MRKVPLKVVEISDVIGRENQLAYIDIFEQLAKTSERGLTAAEMDTPLAIADSLQSARRSNARHIMLEEQEWVYLTERARINRWPFASPIFQDLIRDLERAEKVDPNAAISLASGN